MAGPAVPVQPPRACDTRTESPLLLEFVVTVCISFLVLLALLYSLEYYLRCFVVVPDSDPKTIADRIYRTISVLSPKDVFSVTVVCAGVVFGAMGLVAWLRSGSVLERDVEDGASADLAPELERDGKSGVAFRIASQHPSNLGL
ncbi:hypothetical protein MKEN_01338700 [Mycena kentingensis (nom. inval.)]|nr:hypothetical protein MKEN_01338700 [Mycena kentingensis (nom. inval.)]